VPACVTRVRVGSLLYSAPSYIDWGEGNLPNTHCNRSCSLFPPQRHLHPTSRAAAVPTPASPTATSLPRFRSRWRCPPPGATAHLPAAKSGTAQGVFLSLWLLGGGNGTARPGLLKSLSREGGKNQKGHQSSPRVCVGEIWETKPSPAAAPSAGELLLPQGCPLQQPVFKVL